MNSTILSTKVLTSTQQELILNAGLGFSHYNAISINFLKFSWPNEQFDHLIFTSQNGVKSYLQNKIPSGSKNYGLEAKGIFCVGEKTKSLLEQNRLKVIEMAQNSLELAQNIAKTYQNRSFLHISGNLRTEDISKVLTENNIGYKAIMGYETTLECKQFDREFDGILFFSPSAVKSFTKMNRIIGTAFCIGETTAAEAQKHTNSIVVAKKPTIENVIVQAVKHFNQNNEIT